MKRVPRSHKYVCRRETCTDPEERPLIASARMRIGDDLRGEIKPPLRDREDTFRGSSMV